jgi:hypothetical protein
MPRSSRATGPDPAGGTLLGPEDQPALHALVAEIAARTRLPSPDRVRLLAGTEARSGREGGFIGLGGARTVSIGLGLLSVQTAAELAATLGHELRHLALPRALPLPVPGLAARRARARELSADRAAVRAAGKAAHASAIAGAIRAGPLWEAFWQSEVEPLLVHGFRPVNLYDGFAAFDAAVDEHGLGARVSDAVEAAPAEGDHPSVAERLRAVRDLPDPRLPEDARPARSLLSNAERLERALSAAEIARASGRTDLEAVGWTEVADRVWAPRLAAEGRRIAARVASGWGVPATPASALRALCTSLEGSHDEAAATVLDPALSGASAVERRRRAPEIASHALGTLLGCALVEAGGAWRSELGRPLEVARGALRIAPWALAAEALDDRGRIAALLRMVAEAPQRG